MGAEFRQALSARGPRRLRNAPHGGDGRGQAVALGSLAIFLFPHIGLSARKASTASMRAGGRFGRSGCRVGLAPTEKRRLVTADT